MQGSRGTRAGRRTLVALACAALVGCAPGDPATSASPSASARPGPTPSASAAPEWFTLVDGFDRTALLHGAASDEVIAIAYHDDDQTVIARSEGGPWLEWLGVPTNTTGGDPGNGGNVQELRASGSDLVFAVTTDVGAFPNRLYAWRAGEAVPHVLLEGDAFGWDYSVAAGEAFVAIATGDQTCLTAVGLDSTLAAPALREIVCVGAGEWVSAPDVDEGGGLVAGVWDSDASCYSGAIRIVAGGEPQRIVLPDCAYTVAGGPDFLSWVIVTGGNYDAAAIMADSGAGATQIGTGLANTVVACGDELFWAADTGRVLRKWSAAGGTEVALAPPSPATVSQLNCADGLLTFVLTSGDSASLAAIQPVNPPPPLP